MFKVMMLFISFLLAISSIVISCVIAPAAYATTAVDDVAVNYLTSFHISGPEGWPSTGNPFSLPYYNAERDELIGMTVANTSSVYAMLPSHSHYYKVIDGVRSYSGLAKHPLQDTLYSLVWSSKERVSQVLTLNTDGSTPVYIDQDDAIKINSVLVKPVFDNLGRLYFVDTNYGDTSRLLRLELDGSITLVRQFLPGPNGQNTIPNGFIISTDGWLYGLLAYERGTAYFDALSDDPGFPVGALYRINPQQPGSFEILHTFVLKQGELPAKMSSVSEGRVPAYLIEDEQGYLYGGTSVGSCKVMTLGGVNKDTPKINTDNGYLCGGVYQLYDTSSSVLEIPTAAPHYDGDNPFGSLYRIKKDGSEFNLLHTFTNTDGSQPRGPMVITPDGYLYGTTLSGGVHKTEIGYSGLRAGVEYPRDERNMSPDGTIYRLKLDEIRIENGEVINSGFEHVHSFKAGPYEDTDGKVPLGLMLAENGRIYGTTRYGGRAYVSGSSRAYQFDISGTVFEIDLEAKKPGGSIVVSATPGSIGPGEEAEITWSGGSISNCLASGGSEQDSWQQSEDAAVMGSIKVAPEPGIYYYTINCADDLKGGRVGAMATLYVDAEAKIKDSNALSYGNGAGALSYYLLLIFFFFYRVRVRSCNVWRLINAK